MRRHISKGASLALIVVMYVIAIAAGIAFFLKMAGKMPEWAALLGADVVSTLVIWAFGLVYKNVSVYDPYWSVAPPVILAAWALYKGCWTQPVILLLAAVWCWGIRLTGNWVHTFRGLGHEDWRYTHYRVKQPPFLFQLTNLFGLNLVPTLVVFAALLPGLGLFEVDDPVNPLTWLGFGLSLLAVIIQLVSDTQLHRFRKAHPEKVCHIGLWRDGRHPNYFGEILFWWGLWVMYASFKGVDWLILGPIAMTALFLFVSIPLMERRQLHNKPGYREYRRNTRLLI